MEGLNYMKVVKIHIVLVNGNLPTQCISNASADRGLLNVADPVPVSWQNQNSQP